MSALLPKAEITAGQIDVRFVPKADCCNKKAVAGLCLLRFRPHESAALQALGRPDCVQIVEFRNRLGARWQRHPRLLGGRENVDVRRTEIRVVHGADADEPDGWTGLRVVAPNRNPAGWAACDLLTLATRRWRQDDFRLASGVHDTIGFIECVERMRGPGLALAPPAMAGMNNQWRSDQTISDLPTSASAFHDRLHRGVVASKFGGLARLGSLGSCVEEIRDCNPIEDTLWAL
jgi:hypothetical protein